MTDDPRDRLADLGGAPVPPADPVFADRLEQRLRSVATVSPAPAGPPRRRGRWAGLVLRPGVAVAAIALVAIVGAGALRSGDDPAEVLALTAARSASVLLPDGTEIDAVAGLEVPNGAVIEVGSSGSVTVDGDEYGAGAVLEVDEGRIRDVTPAVVDRPGVTPTTTAPAGDRAPVTGDTPSGPPVTPPPTAPPSTRADAPTVTSAPVDRPATSVPPTRVSPTVVPAPAVTLEVTPLDAGRWRLVWTIGADVDVAGWVVRGSAGDPAPDPAGRDGRQVAALRDGDTRALTVSPTGDAAEVSYVVQARAGGGSVIATSNPVVITGSG